MHLTVPPPPHLPHLAGALEGGYFQAANRAQVDAWRNLFGLPPSVRPGDPPLPPPPPKIAQSLFGQPPPMPGRNGAAPPPLPSPELLWAEIFSPEKDRPSYELKEANKAAKTRQGLYAGGAPPPAAPSLPTFTGTPTAPQACADADSSCVQASAGAASREAAEAASSGLMVPWAWPEGKALEGVRALQVASEQLTKALKKEGATDVKVESVDAGTAMRISATFGAGPLSAFTGGRDAVVFVLNSPSRTVSFRASSVGPDAAADESTRARNRARLLRVRAVLFTPFYGWKYAM